MIQMEKIVRSRESDETSGFEKSDARGEQKGFANVVGDENDGFVEAAGEGAEFALKFGACDGIERAERLVHEKDGRVGGESACDADALALSTGEFSGIAPGKFIWIETDEPHHFLEALNPFDLWPLKQTRYKDDILGDGEMGKETGLLNDVADAAAEADEVGFESGAAFDKDLAFRGEEHAVDEPEEGGFAAAAAAEEDEGFAPGNGERDFRNDGAGRNIVDVVADIAKFDGEV